MGMQGINFYSLIILKVRIHVHATVGEWICTHADDKQLLSKHFLLFKSKDGPMLF